MAATQVRGICTCNRKHPDSKGYGTGAGWQGVRLELSDGTVREVDYLFLGTGYQPDIRKLTFIDAALAQRIQENNGYPVLNVRFESSVSHLYFAGLMAGHTFGPTCRFVSGTKGVAPKIAHNIARA